MAAATITFQRVVGPVVPALVLLGFFVWFSNWIPQTRWEPPRARSITAQMSPAELARVGALLVRERGCLTCHTVEPGAGAKGKGRGPNFANLAVRRASGAPNGPSDLVSYLVQSLYDPGAYLVEDFANIMPVSYRPPAKLTYEEVTATVNYLMSLGGTPGVKVGDLPRPPTDAARTSGGATTTVATLEPMAVLEKYNCMTCHAFKAEEERPGPSFLLKNLREHATKRGLGLEAYLMESIVLPRTFVTGDFEPELMPDDYGTQLTASELQAIVTYLASPEAKP